MYHDMFAIPIPVLEKVIRPAIVYVFLVIVLRIFGKRELAQLNAFDLVVLLSLSNTVQNAMIGDDNSVSGGLIGAFSLLFINYLVVRFLYSHKKMDEAVEGSSTMLISNGVLDTEALKRELITHTELETAARRQGFEGISELEECILEPGGAFAMKRKRPTDEETRERELNAKLDTITTELRLLRERMT